GLRRQYEASDAQHTLELPLARPLQRHAERLRAALEAGEAPGVCRVGQELLDQVAAFYRVPPPRLGVLGVGPRRVRDGHLESELHGDYTLATGVLRAWMRTAILGKVTSDRGMLNTLLHEFAHHLDVRLFGLDDTPHTRGCRRGRPPAPGRVRCTQDDGGHAMRHAGVVIGVTLLAGAALAAPAPAGTFTMEQVLSYPFPTELVAAERGGAIAWVLDERGVRNVWTASAPGFAPRPLTRFTEDDGQELTSLAFSPDGSHLVFVRGGDHDENWPAAGDLAPDPASSPEEPRMEVYAADLATGKVVRLGPGDAPAVSPGGRTVAFTHPKDGSVWWAPLAGGAEPQRLFFDHGKARELRWSPDGKTLAFTSARGDHSFIGVYAGHDTPIRYLAPSTSRDAHPRWSPDGQAIAFVRRPGRGGALPPLLEPHPEPWAIWVADVATGNGHAVWSSPETLEGSYPETAGGANLHWAAGGRLVFLGDLDGWPHLYSIPASGGQLTLLTPGAFMVEDVTLTPDRAWVVYNANTGTAPGDGARRHLYKVPVDRAAPEALTAGTGIAWSPVVTGDGSTVAFIEAGARTPPLVSVLPHAGGAPRALDAARVPPDFPAAALVEPKEVSFTSADGWTIHGQLFEPSSGSAPHPGVVFVHGGPPRQMLLGWHYMDYYSNSYAVNQYLASRGFVVLSVNYRLGIGYGHAFHHPQHAGPAGAAEYQDVLAGARFLQTVPGVDPAAIGIWGGSYGGYLTALGLARNSDVFKAGVDMHGVHDWSYTILHDEDGLATTRARYEQYDWERILKRAWESSPVADIATWRSPVLLIQGDDDRNVRFHEMVDLVQRLRKAGVPYEEIVIPNEIHGFLRWHDWLRADEATAAYLAAKLHAKQAPTP
ncbi:MAG TPA: prolyl oligopeptidase family serine peptidase, partial [Thermoanaerobaculaceae bacterium]|nr:prolyl oligopeptidase family serine peptidase [Thermoanaerobaculaceae bacterium]